MSIQAQTVQVQQAVQAGRAEKIIVSIPVSDLPYNIPIRAFANSSTLLQKGGLASYSYKHTRRHPYSGRLLVAPAILYPVAVHLDAAYKVGDASMWRRIMSEYKPNARIAVVLRSGRYYLRYETSDSIVEESISTGLKVAVPARLAGGAVVDLDKIDGEVVVFNSDGDIVMQTGNADTFILGQYEEPLGNMVTRGMTYIAKHIRGRARLYLGYNRGVYYLVVDKRVNGRKIYGIAPLEDAG